MGQITYSTEQSELIKAMMGESSTLVTSYSGTGKTFTLFQGFRHLQVSQPNKKILLLSFNRHLTVEYLQLIQDYGLSNVKASTAHSFILGVVKQQGLKIDGETFQLPNSIARYVHGNKLRELSNSRKSSWQLGQSFNRMLNGKGYGTFLHTFKELLKEGILTHDMYVKVFMENINDYQIDYDILCIDEVQDLQPKLANIVFNVPIKTKVCVGDPFQSLYFFLNGSYSFFTDTRTELFNDKVLSKSFRCSPQIANAVFNSLMKPYMYAKIPFKGTVHTNTDVKTTLFVSNTNNEVLLKSYELAIAGLDYTWRATFKEATSVFLDFLHVRSLLHLYLECNTITEMRKVVKKTENGEVHRNVDDIFLEDILAYKEEIKKVDITFTKYLSTYGSLQTATASSLSRLLDQARLNPYTFLKVIKEKLVKESSRTVSTVHKTKGSTFDKVVLDTGFIPPSDKLLEAIVIHYKKNLKQPVPKNIKLDKAKQIAKDNAHEKCFLGYVQYLNGLYVAITRAKYEVEMLNGNSKWFMDEYNK